MYPRDYINYLRERTKWPKIIEDKDEGLVIWDRGVRAGHVRIPDHYDPVHRIKTLKRAGIDVQAVTLTTPGVHRFGRDSVKWARRVNDYYAKLNEKYPENCACFATLPLNDVGASLDEIERARNELGLKGIGLFTNVNGKYIDEPEFHPIFEKAVKYDLPVFIHPATPTIHNVLRDYRIPTSLWGYPLETTICYTRLVWNGVLEKFPNLKLIATHLGGYIPYQFERIDYAFRGYSREFGYKLNKPPSYI